MNFSRTLQSLSVIAAYVLTAHDVLAVGLAAQAGTDTITTAVRPPAPTTDPRWAALERGHWLADGRADAPRRIYVFTDPNCPYCTRLWSDARPWVKSGKIQLRHVLVGVLTPTSEGKAAAILTTKDPVATLAAYEQAHAIAAAGMIANGTPRPIEDKALKPLAVVPSDIQAILTANSTLMKSLGIRATPGVVALDGQGHVMAQQGLPPYQYGKFFGTR